MNTRRTFLRVFIGGLAINLLLLGIGVSFHMFMIHPLYKSLTDAKYVLADFDRKESSLRTLEQEVERKRNDIAGLDAAFLNPKEISSLEKFVTLLETMARQSAVSLVIHSATVTTEEKDKKQGVFDMSLAGPLAHIVQFVTLAENMPYFTDISTLTISSSQGGQLKAQLHMSVLTL